MSFSRFAVLFLSATCLSSAAFAQAPATPAGNITKDQLPALIREALINDPSIITDAMHKLQEKQEAEARKQAKEAVAKYKDAIYGDMSSPSVGDVQTADVTVVEFFDYHCGYCKQLQPAIAQLVGEDKKVRVIFKELPILSEDSTTAARAAIAVYNIARDKYFAYHTALMTSKGGKFDEKLLLDTAKGLGIDTVKLKAEIAKTDITTELSKNRELAEALGIRGTPAIIIGDELFPGAMPYEEIKKAVDAARAAKTPVASAPAASAPTPAAAAPVAVPAPLAAPAAAAPAVPVVPAAPAAKP